MYEKCEEEQNIHTSSDGSIHSCNQLDNNPTIIWPPLLQWETVLIVWNQNRNTLHWTIIIFWDIFHPLQDIFKRGGLSRGGELSRILLLYLRTSEILLEYKEFSLVGGVLQEGDLLYVYFFYLFMWSFDWRLQWFIMFSIVGIYLVRTKIVWLYLFTCEDTSSLWNPIT